MTGIIDIPGDRGADAVLYGTNLTDDQMRDACVVLAGLALDAAGGDWAAARDMLAGPLEAVGAVSYESYPRGAWGRQL